MSATTYDAKEARKRSVDNLQRLYTFVVSLAVTELLRRMLTPPSGDYGAWLMNAKRATVDQLAQGRLHQTMRDLPESLTRTLEQLHDLDLGFWGRLFRPQLAGLPVRFYWRVIVTDPFTVRVETC